MSLFFRSLCVLTSKENERMWPSWVTSGFYVTFALLITSVPLVLFDTERSRLVFAVIAGPLLALGACVVHFVTVTRPLLELRMAVGAVTLPVPGSHPPDSEAATGTATAIPSSSRRLPSFDQALLNRIVVGNHHSDIFALQGQCRDTCEVISRLRLVIKATAAAVAAVQPPSIALGDSSAASAASPLIPRVRVDSAANGTPPPSARRNRAPPTRRPKGHAGGSDSDGFLTPDATPIHGDRVSSRGRPVIPPLDLPERAAADDTDGAVAVRLANNFATPGNDHRRSVNNSNAAGDAGLAAAVVPSPMPSNPWLSVVTSRAGDADDDGTLRSCEAIVTHQHDDAHDVSMPHHARMSLTMTAEGEPATPGEVAMFTPTSGQLPLPLCLPPRSRRFESRSDDGDDVFFYVTLSPAQGTSNTTLLSKLSLRGGPAAAAVAYAVPLEQPGLHASPLAVPSLSITSVVEAFWVTPVAVPRTTKPSDDAATCTMSPAVRRERKPISTFYDRSWMLSTELVVDASSELIAASTDVVGQEAVASAAPTRTPFGDRNGDLHQPTAPVATPLSPEALGRRPEVKLEVAFAWLPTSLSPPRFLLRAMQTTTVENARPQWRAVLTALLVDERSPPPHMPEDCVITYAEIQPGSERSLWLFSRASSQPQSATPGVGGAIDPHGTTANVSRNGCIILHGVRIRDGAEVRQHFHR